MFCFGLQSIARFINTNVSYFTTHRWESEGKFPKTLNLSRTKIRMSFTGLGRSVLGETVPSGDTQDLGHSFYQYGLPCR